MLCIFLVFPLPAYHDGSWKVSEYILDVEFNTTGSFPLFNDGMRSIEVVFLGLKRGLK